MIKQVLTAGSLVLSVSIFCQMGINTTDPKATLDILAKTNNGSHPEGLIAPRLTGDEIKAADAQYNEAQKGTIIYATAAVTTSSTKTTYITTPGYYYFDGTIWQKVANGNTYTGSVSVPLEGSSFQRAALTGDVTSAKNSNSTLISNSAVTSAKILDGAVANVDLDSGVGGLYKGSGSLNGSTTVSQGANALAFTSTSTNGFSVDGSTFSVDAANHRVGVGTASPKAKLDVDGSQYLNAAKTNSETKNALDINIGDDGYAYGNRGDGYGIHIKTNSSSQRGSIGRINFGDTGVAGGANTGNRYLSFSVGKELKELMYLTDVSSGQIGVNTITPQKTLHVNGSLQVVNELNLGGSAAASGSAGNSGQVLTSSGSGNAPTWTTPPVITNIYNSNGTLTGNRTVTQGANTLSFTSTTTNGFSVDGSTFSVDAANDRVGVGTTAPTNTLDVNGTARIRTINSVSSNTFITPIYTDENNVLTKPKDLIFSVQRNQVSVDSGAVGTLLTGLVNGKQYRLTVSVTDGCVYSVIADFFVVSSSFNGNVAIKGIDGLFTGGTSAATKMVTFTESERNMTRLTCSGNSGCADGGNSTALNYTLTVSDSPIGTINIRNDGNVARTYSATLVRLN